MDQKPRSRANTVIGQIKWWTSNHHLTNNTNTNTNTNNNIKSFGSSIAVQKLRESKWFGPDESRIFCAVIECGFIVETREGKENGGWFGVVNCKTSKVQKLRESKWFGPDESRIFCAVIECGFIVETREGKENGGWFGVVNCKTSKEKKPKPENIEIYTLKTTSDRRCKVTKLTLADVWKQGCIIRINNFGDKDKVPHSEKDIKNQLSFGAKAKQMLWHDSQHFALWCRYGDRQQDIRRRQISDCVKWGSVGMNAGLIMMMNRRQTHPSAMH